jgi:hypothetical protein
MKKKSIEKIVSTIEWLLLVRGYYQWVAIPSEWWLPGAMTSQGLLWVSDYFKMGEPETKIKE